MASRIEIIRASNSDGPAPLSACLSAATAPVATSISPATMIPLNIVHPVMKAGAPPASGLKFRTKQKAQARWSLGPKRYCPDNRNPPTDPMACLERERDSGSGTITPGPVRRRLNGEIGRAAWREKVGQ